MGAVFSFVLPLEGNHPSVRMLIAASEFWGLLGAIAGGAFAMCIAVDNLRSARQLSKLRGLTWGVLSALVVPIGERLGANLFAGPAVSWSLVALLVEFGIAGALCGIGTAALGRRDDTSETPPRLRLSPTRGLSFARSRVGNVARRIREVVRLWFTPAAGPGARPSRESLVSSIALHAA